jgi:uncharacterized protein
MMDKGVEISVTDAPVDSGELKMKFVEKEKAGLVPDFQLGPLNVLESLGLNNAHVQETSLLDEVGLEALMAMAFYARGVDRGASALLIALDQDAPYVNENFAWFKERVGSFVYIDRVIVAESARGQGIARLLYEDLFAKARAAGQERVVCEVNLDPPNPGSDAIHGGAKMVRYFERRISIRESHQNEMISSPGTN